jgi:hypothetical protein
MFRTEATIYKKADNQKRIIIMSLMGEDVYRAAVDRRACNSNTRRVATVLELLHKVLLERWSDAARVTLTRLCLSLVPSRYGERAQAKDSRGPAGAERASWLRGP